MAERETLALGGSASINATQGSLSEVFHVSYRRLVVQLYGVVGNAGEAEDLVHEAFVRASAAGARFLRVDNPEAWLRRPPSTCTGTGGASCATSLASNPGW